MAGVDSGNCDFVVGSVCHEKNENLPTDGQTRVFHNIQWSVGLLVLSGIPVVGEAVGGPGRS